MFNIKQFPIFYVNVLGFFCLCSFVSASPIVNYQEKTCEELDDLINRIFEEDLVETKEVKENAEKIYNAVKFKDCSSVEDAMNLVGLLYYNRNERLQAKDILSKVDSILVADNRLNSKTNVRNKLYLGLSEQIGGNFKLAHIYFQKALRISQDISFNKGTLQAYLNLSLRHIKESNFKEARKLLSLASQYSAGFNLLGGYVYQNLARTYMVEKNYEQAEHYTKEAMKMWLPMDFSKGLYFCNINLAEIHLANKDTVNWKLQLDKALYFGEKEQSYSRHTIYYTIGLYHYNRSEYKETKEFFEKALTQSASFQEKEIITIVESLLNIYEKEGDIENIKRVNERAIEFYDSKSDLFLKEAEKWQLKELMLEKEIRENEFLRFRNSAYYYTLIGTVLFFSVFGFLILKYLRETEEKKRLEEAQEFRAIVSSNLHDDVGSVLSGLAMKTELMAMTSDEKSREELNGISAISREAMASLRDTVWAMDARKDKYDNLIDKMIEHGKVQLGYKGIKFEFDVEKNSSISYINPEKRQNLFLIFKEAIANVLKHSNAEKVFLKVVQDNTDFKMTIRDNGDIYENKKSEGSGLLNMKMRAQKIGAKMMLNSTDGFEISIKMPV